VAAIDPKELLLRNKLLVIAYVLAIVPIILYFPLVENGVKADYKTATGALTKNANAAKGMAKKIKEPNATPPVYTQGDVEAFKARQEKYAAELNNLVAVVEGADAGLERWFDLFKDRKPDTADYVTEYGKQMGLVGEKYKPVVTGPAGEDFTYNDIPTGDALQRYQKRYWIQLAVLEALTQAQVGNEGAPIRLQQKIEFPTSQVPTDGPIERIPARVTVICPFPRVPMVIRELLARDIPMRVASMRVDKEPFAYEAADPRFKHFSEAKPRLSIDGRESIFQQDAYTAQLTAKEQYQGQEHWIPEPPVKLELMVETFDINKSKLPAPPPPAEGEAEKGN
jgi:hypothetical protein